MNPSITIFCLLLSLLFTGLNAQIPDVEKSFAIIHSTKDYQAALQTANEASEKLDLAVNLRGYAPHPTLGLDTDSICGCGENHGYIARGRWDDGEYISIEYSDQYQGFAEGYYVVMISSREKGSEPLKEVVARAKSYYADAYVKTASVYVGCMH
ncbi:MAG: hypothetical protein AAF206_12770 [Bacteroidota bacterium]